MVAHLGALGPLPAAGYLAGQAVSSALFELFSDDGAGLSVYNDPDVFYEATPDDLVAAKAALRTLDTVEFQEASVNYDSGQLRLAVDKAYEVVRSSRVGLVNSVAYRRPLSCSRSSRMVQLLQGFDINCTQVGVDLATQRLEWTPAFDEFRQTRQLLIGNVQTPNHTAMRWFKKRRDLPGAFGNDERAMETISLLTHAEMPEWRREYEEQSDLRWRFGDKNARLYQSHQRELSDYFEMEQDNQGFFLLTPCQTPDHKLIQLARRYPVRLLPYWYNEIHKPRKAARKALVHDLLQDGCCPEWSLQLTQASYIHQGEVYITGAVDRQALRRVNEFARDRAFLRRAFFGLTATEQCAEMREWEGIERDFGYWGIGYVRLQSERYCEFGFARAAERRAMLVDKHIRNVNPDEPLYFRDPFHASFRDFECRELLTRRELIDEGNDLRHCVGGYATEVRQGISRIFQVRHNLDTTRWSTIELCKWGTFGGPPRWDVSQHFAFENTTPAPDAVDIERGLVAAILWIEQTKLAPAHPINAPDMSHEIQLAASAKPELARNIDVLFAPDFPQPSPIKPRPQINLTFAARLQHWFRALRTALL